MYVLRILLNENDGKKAIDFAGFILNIERVRDVEMEWIGGGQRIGCSMSHHHQYSTFSKWIN